MRIRFFPFALAAIVLLPAAAAAQAGVVAGTVRRADGSPIDGARVSVQLPARSATTDRSGQYALRGLPAGDYRVTITAIGQRLAQRDVRVAAGQTTTLDVRLENGPLMLSGIVTSATRSPAEASRVAATVNVLTSEQIRTSPARETQDLLREIPGVELARTSSLVGGSAQIVSIRGVDEGRTAVMFDGIPVNDAWGEWIDWGRVPKALVDRVEVLEGGGSNLYGNGAMGGVISFFAKPIAPGSYELQLDGGSRDAKHASASAGVPLAPALTAMVSGDYLDGGGYRMIAPASAGPVDHRSAISSRNGMARVEFAPSKRLSTFVSGNVYNDNRDLGTALAHTNRDDKRLTFGADLDNGSYGALTLRGWNGILVEDQYASAVTPAVGRTAERQTSWQHIPTHDWGASLQWARDGVLGLRTLIAGADVRKMTGSVAEEDYAADGSVSANIQSGGSQLLSGAFVQGILSPVEPLRIEIGGRYDRWGNNDGFSVDANGNTLYPDESYDHFSPRIGAAYRVSSMLTLRGALYDAFRAPNLAEMYRKFVSGPNTNLPNPALRPESARGQEVGFDLQPASWLQLRGTYYSAIYSDFNSFVTIAPNTRQRQNVQRSRSTGGEAYLALQPVEELLLSASVNYDHAVVVTNDANPAAVGSYIGRVPQQRQVIRATYRTPALGSITALWRHEGKNSTFNGTQLDPFTVVDANYTRDLMRGLSLFASVENVGDVKYQVNYSGGIVSLGLPRTVRAGVRVGRE
ncbi:MAG TPA: TonB-dependent receptor [Gemmatimonadaceae bacterium]|nr:TonB-dependent receptor [Gemmatimonadaceae bacterium]